MSDPDMTMEGNGGDVVLGADGDLVLGNGLTTAAILSMFGSNADDNGLPSGDANQYWGNSVFPVEATKLRGETQQLLTGLPVTTSNLLLVSDAVVRDLAWFVSEGLAKEYAVQVDLVTPKRIRITVDFVLQDDQVERLQLEKEWGTE
jgi:phage gp46-like protein